MPATRRAFICTGIATIVVSQFANVDDCSARALDYDVPGSFPILKQQGDTCWAATATMMYNWKHQSVKSIDEVMKMAGPIYASKYSNKAALSLSSKPGLLKFLSLTSEPPASYPPAAIRNLMERSGILWATTFINVENCNFSVHARIIRGIEGDDSQIDKLKLKVVDPVTGQESKEPITQFYQEFEQYAKEENKCDVRTPLQPQLFHY